ncbi:MAG: hypothetical protein ACOY41_04705 [Pseudomonadota bacterium]
MTRLTVVQILPALQAGGVERCTLETARALLATTRQWLDQPSRPAPPSHCLLSGMGAETIALYEALVRA